MNPILCRNVCAAVALLCAAAGAAPSRAAWNATPPEPSSWKPAEIVVKLRPDSDPRLAKSLAGADVPVQSLPVSLRKLHQTNSIAGLRPVAHPAWAGRLPATSALHGTYVVQVANRASDIPALCRSLAKDPAIQYAEPNFVMKATFTPNDPFFSSAGSWGQDYDDQWGLKIAHVPAAWDLVMGSNEIVVAVLDTGIDFTHPDLQGKIATNGWNYVNNTPNPIDDFGHGTFCAGIIAAVVNNGAGIAGVCPNAVILPVKFLNSTGRGYASDAASAVDYAINQGARIINMSFSGPDSSQVLQQAIDSAHANNAVLIASAGNNGSTIREYPAAYHNVITVGATDHADHLADFSNYGAGMDVVAPGGDSGDSAVGNSILSLRAANTSPGTPLDSLYARWRGTSFSAPFVCGVAALMRTHQPRLQNERVRQILRTTADDLLDPGWDWQTGYGRVNAYAALQPTNAVITVIDSPVNYQYAAGTLAITGTAYGIPFAWSVVEWAAGWQPTAWTLLASNSTAVYNTTLASWDTTQVPDGDYTVRLRTADPAGNRYEDRIAFSVYNQRYNFDPPEHAGWPQPGGLANPSMPVMADLNGDGRKELLWAVRHSMIVKQGNGTNYPGWPKAIPGSPRGPVSVADLDGDGVPEIGVISDGDSFGGTAPDTLFLWHADGTPVAGWPKTFTAADPFVVTDVSPVFADIDGDGTNEVIWCSAGTNSGSLNPTTVIHVDRYDGTPLPGWPVMLPDPAERTFCPPAVGDVDGDGKLDIALITLNGWLYLLHHDGRIFDGWPVKLAGSGLGGAPAFADVDHDGQLEVFGETYEGSVACYKADGSLVPGWPIQVHGIPWPPAFGDLLGDGRLEIAFSWNQSGIGVFQADGNLLEGWPPKYGSGWFMPPVIADLDGDGKLDVASADNDGYVRGWNASGNELYNLGFPIKASAATCFSGPVLGDVAGNGRLNLLVMGIDNDNGIVFDLWDLPTPADPSRLPYPTMLGDNAHQSRYHVPPALLSISPPAATTNEGATFTIAGDHYLKGMRVLLGAVPQPVLSETVTSIVFTLSPGLAPRRYDLTISNVNSSATTLAQAVAVVSSWDGDDDHDGLPNGWELQHGLDPFDNGTLNPDNGALGDPDHDGASNLAEFRAGTDPRYPASVFVIKRAEWQPAGGIAIIWASAEGKQYSVYRATNVTGPFGLVTNHVPATPPENRFFEDPAGAAGPLYYRVGVE